MWYVIQVPTSREEHLCRLIEQADRDAAKLAGTAPLLLECFVPTCEFERKRRGEWKRVRLPLFPGYVVADTKDPVGLYRLLHEIPQFTRLLKMGETVTALDPAECELIQTFADTPTRTVKMSVGVYEGDHVRVVSGPLMGHEGQIKEVNRRGGVALLEVRMFDRTTIAKVGLAIVAKRGEQQNTKRASRC